jgi:spermidine synthase
MNSLKHMLLPLSVFVTGASILIVEVVGVRILAPFYGNTIFTVSSVISVILLALGCGYYLGGKLADRRPTLQYFFGLILISGLVQLLFYSLGKFVLPVLSAKLSITTGPLLSATLLFLLPALLLGTLCPYAIKVQSIRAPQKGIGVIAGGIFFWSTLGSIAGSLSAGFVLIPRFGIDRILITNGVVLSLLGFVPLLILHAKTSRMYASALLLVVAVGGAGFASRHARRQVLYTEDGVYQKITIYDGQYAGRPTRFFQQDENSAGAGEGAMFLDSDDPADLVYDYTRYYSLYKIFHPHIRNALVIGAGAYSVPKALLQELPDAAVDVVDIEPSLFSLAKRYFKVPENQRLQNHVEDGRRFLRDSNQKYDLIFADVYYSFFSVPPHFATQEFFAIAKQKLSANGILVCNVIGDLSRQQPSLIMAEIKTFQTVFPNSYFFAVAWPERTDSQNVMLVGYNSDTRMDLNSPSFLTNRDALIRSLASKVIDVERRFDLSPYPILTDNFSPIEFLTAKVLQRAFAPEKLIDGDEMLADVAQQERYGPRYPGAEGHAKEREFLAAEMKLLAQDVKIQTWHSSAPDGQSYDRANIISRFYTAPRRIVLATHYGSSPLLRPDQTDFPGAGDSSGTSVLVELARSFADLNVPPVVGIDIVFFDGAGADKEDRHRADSDLSGSNYFANHLRELYGDNKPALAIVLDNVCRKNLRILKEQSSSRTAAAQVHALWKVARRFDPNVFQDRIGPPIDDDQEPLTQAGIPTVLLIDSEYPRFDGAENPPPRECSSRSLEAIGQALIQYVTLPERVLATEGTASGLLKVRRESERLR